MVPLNSPERPSCKQPQKTDLRKLFGVYFHNHSAHAGLMLRIVSGQASNAEGQERIFNSIKRITKQTSNYHPGQIIPKIFIRLQAEKEIGLQENNTERQQAHVSKLSKCLPQQTNIQIPIALIKKHNRSWQAHLQQTSDFLAEGEGVWWSLRMDVVEFHDISNHHSQEKAGPQLHHFRSSTLKQEHDHLKHCWEQILQQGTTIPIHVIRIDQTDGSTQKVYTTYLGDEVPTAGEQHTDSVQIAQKTPEQPALLPEIQPPDSTTNDLAEVCDQEEILV